LSLDLYRRADASFILISPDRTALFFDASGRLTKLADRNTTKIDGSDGNAMKFLYDGRGRLATVLDATDRAIHFAYYEDSDAGKPGAYVGLISSVTDFDGRIVNYRYDSAGRLTDVEGPDPGSASSRTPHTTLAWTPVPSADLKQILYRSGELVSATDGEGREVFAAAYRGDQPASVDDVKLGGGTWQLSYGATTEVSDPNGNVVAYAHDSAGRALSVSEPGPAGTSFEYDSEGRLTTLTRPLGDKVTYAYASAQGNSKLPMGDVTQVTEYPRTGSAEAQANLTRVTKIEYGAANLPTKLIAPDGATTTIVRDSRGNPTTATDAAGVATMLTFNSYGQVSNVDDARTGHRDYTYETSDPLKKGYLTAVTDPAGTANYTVDDRGNVVEMVDASNKTVTLTVNKLDQTEAEARGNSVTSTSYDAAGNLLGRDVLAGSDGSGNPVFSHTQYQIDELGRMRSRTEDGRATNYAYDLAGNLAGVTPPAPPATTFSYDSRNRLASMTTGGRTTAFAYDSDGTRTSSKNARGKTTTFAIDGFGETAGETDPLGIETLTRLDAAGRPVDTRIIRTKSDGTNLLLRWTTRTYDPLARRSPSFSPTRSSFQRTGAIPAERPTS
jgi:YD repeat-containing protein